MLLNGLSSSENDTLCGSPLPMLKSVIYYCNRHFDGLRVPVPVLSNSPEYLSS